MSAPEAKQPTQSKHSTIDTVQWPKSPWDVGVFVVLMVAVQVVLGFGMWLLCHGCDLCPDDRMLRFCKETSSSADNVTTFPYSTRAPQVLFYDPGPHQVLSLVRDLENLHNDHQTILTEVSLFEQRSSVLGDEDARGALYDLHVNSSAIKSKAEDLLELFHGLRSAFCHNYIFNRPSRELSWFQWRLPHPLQALMPNGLAGSFISVPWTHHSSRLVTRQEERGLWLMWMVEDAIQVIESMQPMHRELARASRDGTHLLVEACSNTKGSLCTSSVPLALQVFATAKRLLFNNSSNSTMRTPSTAME